MLGSIQKKYKAAVDELRSEVTTLKREVVGLRAEAKLRGTLDDMRARLEKLETPPRLRAMS
jgi:hypothetical protein